MPFTPLFSLLSPSGRTARLSILIYHRVLAKPDPLLPGVPDRETFRWQMRFIRRHFQPLPLSEAADRLRDEQLPSRAICVTFDDGYADNATEALPVLQETGVPATFFVAAGYLNGGRMFNDTVLETVRRLPQGPLDLGPEGLGPREIQANADRLALSGELIMGLKYLDRELRQARAAALAERFGVELPGDLMMCDDQVRQLENAGMTIGGHTLNHPILSQLPDAEAFEEIRQGKYALETLLKRPVRLFAYPNGRPGKDYRPEHTIMLRELGFEAACSTAWGTACRDSDPFQLPRFTPWDQTPLRFGVRLGRNLLGRA
ncbi:MAG: polysaccharide deacetylase family protein [Lamprobacter sp.]|uniref:polysaccharide deacetylase family protein n=1 Tax=Lamprobacter sp. TaxID=3100796 RepID=UPI002B259DA6|nr:polysaccharide deacetylase family protein [Lamprobacter sp.]MEA3642018.1 polysaccharide deacetylase family protein [Lamprobacter sp.]